MSFVRELHERDQSGPGSFPLHATPLGLASMGKASAFAQEVVGLKLTEAFKRGHVDSRAAPLGEGVGAITIEPHVPALTEPAAEAFDRALLKKPLSQSDLIHLETIVLPALRPAFDIQGGSYENLPASWAPLNAQRGILETLIRGIGRLQLTGHPSFTLVGTGFVCSMHGILTNRHVAQIFVQGIESGQQLMFQPGVSCAMDMVAEVGSPKALLLDLARPVSVSTTWDVALLRVEALPAGITPLPLAGAQPAAISNEVAAIVGYPSYDPYESFVDQANIFRSVFDKKRLQPGKLNGRVDVLSFDHTVSALAHDCSTLGGNSGSALISVDLGRVVGIHFSGVVHQSNYAVPTWELAGDPAFTGESLNFV